MIFQTPNGKIHYEVEGDGKPVLIIHGLGGLTESMKPLSEGLVGMRKVLVDLPCHGSSDDFQITLEDLAMYLVKLMNSLGHKKFYVVGISLGSIVSEILTLRYSDAVIVPFFISPASHIDEAAINMVSSWVTSEDGGASTLFSPEFFQLHKDEILEFNRLYPLKPERLIPMIPEIIKFNINGEKSLKKCMIIYGKYDDLFGRRMIDTMLKIFPNCKTIELNTGHSIHRESPSYAARLIMEEIEKSK